jgi:DNA-binding transcriptional MerR regulator/methylmalonyl-CoA mutase cobalamin-binding subunit
MSARPTELGPGPYRIHAAADLSGVNAATLRAWERRYGVPVPRRTASAYRLYTVEDVAQIRRMRELVDQGIAPAEAARSVRAPALPPEVSASADGIESMRERLVAAAERFDPVAMDAEIARASMLLDAQTLYERVISPVAVEIGARWESGALSVAQEHLVSERIEFALRATLRSLERPDGPTVVLACVDGEQHVIGMLGAALRFAANGARVVVLGATTPPEAIADAVARIAPRVVALSVTIAPPSARARQLFRAYAQACGDVRWVVGGSAAEHVRTAVNVAGGELAIGPASAWHTHVREWLRATRR